MKKDIHPPYHTITIVMTNGKKRQIRTTYGKPDDVLHLDIDSESHPAWTGQRRTLEKGGQIDRFKNRYGDLGTSQ